MPVEAALDEATNGAFLGPALWPRCARPAEAHGSAAVLRAGAGAVARARTW